MSGRARRKSQRWKLYLGRLSGVHRQWNVRLRHFTKKHLIRILPVHMSFGSIPSSGFFVTGQEVYFGVNFLEDKFLSLVGNGPIYQSQSINQDAIYFYRGK